MGALDGKVAVIAGGTNGLGAARQSCSCTKVSK